MNTSSLVSTRNWGYLVLVGALASVTVGLSGPARAGAEMPPQGLRAFDHGPHCDMRKELGFHDAMRKLWEDHIT